VAPYGVKRESIKRHQVVEIVFMKIGIVGGYELVTYQDTGHCYGKTKNKYDDVNQTDH
jgi:hypothetical protein